MWIIGEERLDDAEVVRFYNDANDGCENTAARKIPSLDVVPGNTDSYIDTETTACQSVSHNISPENHRYQTTFNSYVSTCNAGAHYNCYTEWGSTTDCSQATITGDLHSFE